SVEPVGGKLRVQLRLIDGNSGVDLPGARASFDIPATNLLDLRDSLAGEASDLIRKRLGEEIALRQERSTTRSVSAWSLVQQARALKRKGEELAKAGSRERVFRNFDSADSLAAAAVTADPQWIEPILLRALLAYRRSYYLGQSDPALARPWIDSGMVRVA